MASGAVTFTVGPSRAVNVRSDELPLKVIKFPDTVAPVMTDQLVPDMPAATKFAGVLFISLFR